MRRKVQFRISDETGANVASEVVYVLRPGANLTSGGDTTISAAGSGTVRVTHPGALKSGDKVFWRDTSDNVTSQMTLDSDPSYSASGYWEITLNNATGSDISVGTTGRLVLDYTVSGSRQTTYDQDSGGTTTVGVPSVSSNGEVEFFVDIPDIDIAVTQNGTLSGYWVDVSADPRDYVTPEEFGAVGDGSTDDYLAIQKAIHYIVNSGGGIVKFGGGVYSVQSTVTVDRGSSVATDSTRSVLIDLGDSYLKGPTSLDAPIIRVGNNSHLNFNVDIENGTVGYASQNWDSTDDDNSAVCVELVNCWQCRVENVGVERGWGGIRLRANNANGCVHNSVLRCSAEDCLNAFGLNRESTTSFTNENSFISNRCSYNSGLSDASSGYGVSLLVDSESGNTVNNNKFVANSFECNMASNKPTGIYDQYGVFNAFSWNRYEGFDTPYFSLGASTTKDYISGGWLDDVEDAIDSTDYNKCMVQTAKDWQLFGGSASRATFTVGNSFSSSNYAIEVKNATNTAETFSVTSAGALRVLAGINLRGSDLTNLGSIGAFTAAGTVDLDGNNITMGGGDIDMENGQILNNAKTYGAQSMNGNASATTVTTATTFYKVAGTTTAGESSSDVELTTTNRLKYTGAQTRIFRYVATFDMTGSNNETYYFKVWKYDDSGASGALLDEAEIHRYVSNSANVGAAAINCMVELAQNDYLELHCSVDTTNGATVTVENMQHSIVEV